MSEDSSAAARSNRPCTRRAEGSSGAAVLRRGIVEHHTASTVSATRAGRCGYLRSLGRWRVKGVCDGVAEAELRPGARGGVPGVDASACTGGCDEGAMNARLEVSVGLPVLMRRGGAVKPCRAVRISMAFRD